MGFNKFDANRMSKLAILVINGMGLTPTQMFTARQIMKKYCGQLYDISIKTVERRTI